MPRRLSYCNFTLSRRKNATLDATSVHLLDGRLTFANGRSGSRLNSTRLNPRPPQCQMLEVPALMARVTPPPSRPCAGTCGYPPARNAAVQVMPPTPGVMVAVERPLAMEKSSSNPPPPLACAPVPVMPLMKTPALLPVPLVPWVGAVLSTALAVEVPPHFFSTSIQQPSPLPPVRGYLW